MRNFNPKNECDLMGEIREEHMFPFGIYTKAEIDNIRKELDEEIQKKANITDLDAKLDKAVYDESIPESAIAELYRSDISDADPETPEESEVES